MFKIFEGKHQAKIAAAWLALILVGMFAGVQNLVILGCTGLILVRLGWREYPPESIAPSVPINPHGGWADFAQHPMGDRSRASVASLEMLPPIDVLRGNGESPIDSHEVPRDTMELSDAWTPRGTLVMPERR